MAQSFIIPSEKSIERRRRLAEVMGQQGTSTAPIQSWTQGAARLAQALSGGLDERQANQMESQRNSALQQALSGGATPDQLASSLDPQLMQVAQFRELQAQRKAQLERQQTEDAYNHGRDKVSDQHWQTSQDATAEERRIDNERADAANIRADTAAANQAPTTRQITKPDGSTVMQQWDPGQRDWFDAPLRNDPNAPPANPNAALLTPKMAESEAKSFRFYRRARQAAKEIGPDEEAALVSGTQNVANAIPYVGNRAVSNPRRRATTAATNFLTSFGYSDSGAQVNRDEYAKHYKMWIPQYGDDPATIEQKRQARAVALESLKGTTGKGVAVLDKEDQAYAEADAAIKSGRDPAAVKKRLQDNGFDVGGY